MPENNTPRKPMLEILESIETGIKELFASEKYAQYLRTMSRFHRYSVNNQMLIYLQRPDATLVAGFDKWQKQFGRNVKKGEKSIRIIAPTPYKKKIEQDKLDPDTKLPMRDADGNIVKEEKEIKIPMFKPVPVFDVAQTDGKPLPQLAENLTGNVQNYDVFLESLKRASPVPISFEPLGIGLDGYFTPSEHRIAIRDGMSEVQTVSAVIHEIAHAKLHDHQIPRDERYQEVEVFGQPALFSNGRIAAEDVPPGMFRYDLRGSDYDPGMPVTIEEQVVVNHAGSILTLKPLEIPAEGAIRLTEEEGINFDGGFMTVSEFLSEHKKDRRTEEVEAESISYAVCQHYGIETGANSFGYIAQWSKDKELNALKESLETINKTSSALISDIDQHYRAICKERGITAEKTQDTEAKDAEPQNTFPDPSVSIEAMQAFGYTDPVMLPLSKDRALELMEKDVTVYMLYADNTESMAFDAADIQSHTGLFGIERDEWNKVREQHQSDNPLKNAEIQTEDDYGMIDGVINNGKRETEPPKAKFVPEQKIPIHERLEQLKAKEEPTKTKTKRKSAERDAL